MATRRAFILAGTGSGCGKTTVTLGLLSLLQQRGMRVQPCKVGPDYLDTAWHTAISGIAVTIIRRNAAPYCCVTASSMNSPTSAGANSS